MDDLIKNYSNRMYFKNTVAEIWSAPNRMYFKNTAAEIWSAHLIFFIC